MNSDWWMVNGDLETIHQSPFTTDHENNCYNKSVTKIYILLEYGLIPGLDEFEHNN